MVDSIANAVSLAKDKADLPRKYLRVEAIPAGATPEKVTPVSLGLIPVGHLIGVSGLG
jgi:hypothetical protein